MARASWCYGLHAGIANTTVHGSGGLEYNLVSWTMILIGDGLTQVLQGNYWYESVDTGINHLMESGMMRYLMQIVVFGESHCYDEHLYDQLLTIILSYNNVVSKALERC